MGLDTTHNAWHGAYGRFNRFRFDLARQIGIDLNDYIGYGNKGTKDLQSIEHDLMPLFNHSDCDGTLDVEDCKKIVNGLNSVLDNMNSSIEQSEDFEERIIQFRNGCMDAISKNEIIEFR